MRTNHIRWNQHNPDERQIMQVRGNITQKVANLLEHKTKDFIEEFTFNRFKEYHVDKMINPKKLIATIKRYLN